MPDLLRRPAVELGRLVREGEVSARELTEASLARIEEVDPGLNAYTLVDAEGALAAADAVKPGDPRPFAGVPIAIKDLFAPVAGLQMTQGSDLLGDYAPDYDSALVRRFRDAGFVIVGKTATPEFGIPPVTEARRFGPTRNPWDPSRTPGGSSGGAGAAVAAGTVPVAHGSDGGGSIRIPAACCGLVGLKPARNRISWAPDIGEHFLSTNAALTRTVGDSAALLDVMAGYEPGMRTGRRHRPSRSPRSRRASRAGCGSASPSTRRSRQRSTLSASGGPATPRRCSDPWDTRSRRSRPPGVAPTCSPRSPSCGRRAWPYRWRTARWPAGRAPPRKTSSR